MKMLKNTSYTESYCVTFQREFQLPYLLHHGYIALIICVFGCAANTVNIILLSRKEMASSINFVLMGLAVADLLVAVDYIPFAYHNYINVSFNQTYAWAVFAFFHVVLSQIVHTIAIWLTISLAVLRYMAIKYPLKSKTLCSQKNTKIAVGLAFVVCPVLCLPIFFATRIKETFLWLSVYSWNTHTSQVTKETQYSLTLTENSNLLIATFWIYSVFMKIIPCIVLSTFSVLLILTMKSSDRSRQKLTNNIVLENTEGERRRGVRNRSDQTTRMLIVVLGFFLATELPQGVLGLLTAITPSLFEDCYFAFGELMDLMALTGSALNFFIYCSMSRQFRRTFTRLVRQMLCLETVQSQAFFTGRQSTGRTFTTNS